jgi:type II secretory pathway pseudopilin PulG
MLWHRRESGMTLLETVVAAAFLGIVATSLLGSLSLSAKSDYLIKVHSEAESLALSQMELIKASSYIDYSEGGHGGYSLIAPPADYTIEVTTVPIDPSTGQALGTGQDNGVQKITITVQLRGEEKATLVGYKVDR